MNPKPSTALILIFLGLSFSLSLFLLAMTKDNSTLQADIISLKKLYTTTISSSSTNQDIRMISATPNGVKQPSASCFYGYCLFTDLKYPGVFGLATLQGFYATSTGQGEAGDEATCNSFVITGGSDELINYYIDNIRQGNTVNSLDQSGRPMINITFDSLSSETISKITSSNEATPIQLTVWQNAPQGKGATACSSTIKILNVK